MADGLILPKTSADPIQLTLPGSGAVSEVPSELLQVFVGQADACCAGRTPMAGRYGVENGSISFQPAFGFDLGQDYIASIRNDEGFERVAFRLGSETETATAAVTDVFPSGDVLPENTLRFYIHFSVPMQPHMAFDYITLRDETGDVDEAAFMRFKQELWNTDRTRLTVLVDPGRIKRNVATNVELGPALREGQTYTLAVGAGWPAADGRSVLPAFAKRFSAGAPLRDLPRLDQWEATRPCVGTQGSLYVRFDRPYDRHLLTQAIRITNAEGRGIAGNLIVGHDEQSLIFTPNAPWTGEAVQIVVDPTLEDVAANNFRDLLDHVASDTDAVAPQVLNIPLNPVCG